jgi:hypothetical protein
MSVYHDQHHTPGWVSFGSGRSALAMHLNLTRPKTGGFGHD